MRQSVPTKTNLPWFIPCLYPITHLPHPPRPSTHPRQHSIACPSVGVLGGSLAVHLSLYKSARSYAQIAEVICTNRRGWVPRRSLALTSLHARGTLLSPWLGWFELFATACKSVRPSVGPHASSGGDARQRSPQGGEEAGGGGDGGAGARSNLNA